VAVVQEYPGEDPLVQALISWNEAANDGGLDDRVVEEDTQGTDKADSLASVRRMEAFLDIRAIARPVVEDSSHSDCASSSHCLEGKAALNFGAFRDPRDDRSIHPAWVRLWERRDCYLAPML